MKSMYSLTELAAELERQNAAKVDYLVPRGKIHFVSVRGDEQLPQGHSTIDLLGAGEDASNLLLNDVCHSQFSDRLKIPKRFYDRLRVEVPDLLDRNVNTLLRHGQDEDGGQPWMIRTLDGVARASLSDTFRRIDNYEIAQQVFHVLSQHEGIQVRSSAVTEKRMYVKAVTEKVEGEVRVGQTVRAGVFVSNSEVGWGSCTIYPFVETLQCTNGMVLERRGEGMMRKIHLGRRLESDGLGRILSKEAQLADDHAFLLALRDVVAAALDEARFHDLVREMAEAARGERLRDVQAAVEVLAKSEDLTEGESRGILTHLAEGGDLSRWGVLSAVTRTAEDLESYDRATELEALGGKILAYAPAQWRALAEAAA